MITKRRIVAPRVREQLLNRYNRMCVYCGEAATEIDHIRPYSWDQNNDEDNLIASCRICNAIASDLMFDTFNEKWSYINARRNPDDEKIDTPELGIPRVCLVCGVSYKSGFSGSNYIECPLCAGAVHDNNGWLPAIWHL